MKNYKITWNCYGSILHDYYTAKNKKEAITEFKNTYDGKIISVKII